MGVTDLVSPISSSDWDEVNFGIDDGTLDGSLDFLSDLSAKANVAVAIADNNVGFESGSLTSLGLLLD